MCYFLVSPSHEGLVYPEHEPNPNYSALNLMRRYRFLALLALLIGGAALSCKKEEESYEPECSGPAKSYAGVVKSVIQSNCVGCHAQYGTYTGVKNAASSIRSSIANGSMPKGRTMSEADKNTVICWIDAGAPNN